MLKKDVLAACESALYGLGFVKRAGTLLRPLSSGASGWVGLNVAAQGLPRSMGVNPVVGVYFEHFADISRALREDVPRQPFPLISKPLGYLMPTKSFKLWEFARDVEVRPIAESLAEAVAHYGVPFMEKYADWEVISREIATGEFLMEHERMKVLPMVLAVDGEVERASEIVRAELVRLGDSEDMYAISYRKFAEKFRDRFAS